MARARKAPAKIGMALCTINCTASVEEPAGFVAVIVAENWPFTIAVPEMMPVEALMLNPAGRPLADHEVTCRFNPSTSMAGVVLKKVFSARVKLCPGVMTGAS